MKSKILFGIALIFLALVVFYIGNEVKKEEIFRMDVGSTVTDTLALSGGERVYVDGFCDIEYFKSDQDLAIVSYSDKLSQNNSKVIDGSVYLAFSQLQVKSFFGSFRDDIKVKLYMDTVRQLSLRGSSSFITEDTIISEDLYIVNEGLGRIELSAIANKIRYEQSGAGSGDARLKSKSLEVKNRGLGGIAIVALSEIVTATNGGAGSINLTGNAISFSAYNTGLGSIDAEDFPCSRGSVENHGAGSVSLTCNDSLSIANYGLGGVTWGGGAELYELVVEGLGKVRER